MATRKVKKFGRGGDILTGVGAALVGKALYDKYMGKGDSKDDDYTSRVKEFGRKGRFPEEKTKEKAEDKVAEDKVAEDKVESKEAVNKAAEDKPSSSNRNAEFAALHSSLTTRPKSAAPAPVIKKSQNQNQNQNKKQSQSQSQSQSNKTAKALQTYSSITAPNPVEDKPAPAKPAAAKPADKKAPGTNTFITEQRSKQANKSIGSAWRSENPEISDFLRGKNRKGTSEVRYDEMGNPYKKGGAIKASKMGSVKTAKPAMRSASSRADGIAIRGKTRA